MAKGLFAKKSIKSLHEEAAVKEEHALKRTLGVGTLTALGVGAIIGAGIFVLSGQAAAQYAGPGVTLSIVIAGLICVFAALCYAEFAALIPVSASAYTYAYVTMGEFIAWIIGWSLTLEYLLSASTVAVGWSGYFVSFVKDLGITIPSYWSSAPFIYEADKGWMASGSLINLPAMVIVALIGFMIAIGIKAAARLNNIMVIIKMIVIVLFIGCGIAYMNSDNLSPLIPENTGIFGQFGWSGVLRGAGLVFFAFIGFDALSTLTQEARNPQRDLPISMLGSLTISTIVYVAIALILVGMVSYKLLDVSDPLAVAVNSMGPKFLWLRYVLKFGILAALTTVILVMLLGQARIFYGMAKDGLLPKRFSKIHPRFQTPFFGTILITIVAMIVAGLFPVVILGNIVNMGTLLIFAVVCFGVLLLRYTQPKLHRPFKTPFMPFVPIIGTAACIIQMCFIPVVTWIQLIGWMIVGCAIYFLYGQKHSKVRHAR